MFAEDLDGKMLSGCLGRDSLRTAVDLWISRRLSGKIPIDRGARRAVREGFSGFDGTNPGNVATP